MAKRTTKKKVAKKTAVKATVNPKLIEARDRVKALRTTLAATRKAQAELAREFFANPNGETGKSYRAVTADVIKLAQQKAKADAARAKLEG